VDLDAADFVFDTLKEACPRKVLLNPSIEKYHKYWYDDMIIVHLLVSEVPKNKKIKWQSWLEKVLVDLLADALLQGILSPAEHPVIISEIRY